MRIKERFNVIVTKGPKNRVTTSSQLEGIKRAVEEMELAKNKVTDPRDTVAEILRMYYPSYKGYWRRYDESFYSSLQIYTFYKMGAKNEFIKIVVGLKF